MRHMIVEYVRCIRMKEDGFSTREIAQHLQISQPSVRGILSFAEQHGLTASKAEEMGNSALVQLHHPKPEEAATKYFQPDLERARERLKNKGVTRELVWKEYVEQTPPGYQFYSYSRYCQLYADHTEQHHLTMRQTYRPGDIMQVDWAGKTLDIHPLGREPLPGYVFVAVLPYSMHTYYELCEDMQEETWLYCHVHAYNFFGGTTRLLIPDNLGTGITRHKRMDIVVNRSYQSMAEYYHTAIAPARVRKPRDKSSGEGAVKLVTHKLMAPLYDRTFLSFAEAREALAERYEEMENRDVIRLGCGRQEYYEKEERSYMRPLPDAPYAPIVFSTQKVHSDYVITVGVNQYSVPYTLVGKQVDLLKYPDKVEVFYDGKLQASHELKTELQRFPVILQEHMPERHKAYLKYTKKDFMEFASSVGPWTKCVFESLFRSCQEPEQVYPHCASLKNLAEKNSSDLLEAACKATAGEAELKVILDYVKHPEKLPSSRQPQSDEIERAHHEAQGFTRGMHDFES